MSDQIKTKIMTQAEFFEVIDKINSMSKHGKDEYLMAFSGVEEAEFAEFGITPSDSAEEATRKWHEGVNKKLENKVYGWYFCEECDSYDCEHIVLENQ